MSKLDKYTHEQIKEIFDYNPESGVLKWRELGREYFSTDRKWRGYNKTKPGTEVGRVSIDEHSLKYNVHEEILKNVRVLHIIYYYMTGEIPNSRTEFVFPIDGDISNIKWDNIERCKRRADWEMEYPIDTHGNVNYQYIRDCFTYNPETGDVFWSYTRPKEHFTSYRSYVKYNRDTAGTLVGYRNGDKKNYLAVKLGIRPYRCQVRLHNVAWLITHGVYPPDTDLVVDHINRKGWDNSIENLRLVTQSDNCRNSEVAKCPIGVSPGIKYNNGRYLLRIKDDSGKWVSYGTHTTIEEAERARLKILEA